MSQMNPWCDFTHFIRVIPRINLSQRTEDSQSFVLRTIAVHGKMTVLPWIFTLNPVNLSSNYKFVAWFWYSLLNHFHSFRKCCMIQPATRCVTKQWAVQSYQNKLISKSAAGFLQPLAKLWQYKQGHLQGGPTSSLYSKRFKDLIGPSISFQQRKYKIIFQKPHKSFIAMIR